MNLFRRFQAGLAARRLHDADDSGRSTRAREDLVALGPHAIRSLFDGIAAGHPANGAEDVLERLLNDETLRLFLVALASPVPAVSEAAERVLARGRGYDATPLLALYGDSAIARARLDRVVVGQITRLQPITLLRALPGLGKEGRVSVFRVLEQHADVSVVPEAVRLTGHAEWWVRLHAVKLLARFPSAQGLEAVTRLTRDDHSGIRLEAVKALGATRSSACLPALCARLRDSDLPVQGAAIEALIAIGDAAAVPHLLDHLKDESEYVRRAAVEVLNQVVTVDAIKDLVDALRDSDWWVRVRAADALGTLGGSRVLDATIALVRDPDEFVRRYAIEILNTVPDKRATEALVFALDDEDWWVRERAVDALGKGGDPRAVEPLLRMLARDVKALPVCIRALGQIGDERAVEPLCRLAGSEQPEVRREAITALGLLARRDHSAEHRRLLAETLQRAGAAAPAGSARPLEVRGNAPESVRQDVSHRRTPPRVEGIEHGSASPTPRPVNFQKLDPGTMLVGRYRVLQRVGGGGFGTVYLVEDVIVREELVLKVLSPQLSLDDQMIRRFVQELRLSRRVTHHNVIRIHDLVDLEGAHAISMEYFAARDLGTLLKAEGPFSVGRVLSVATQTLEGLAAAHDAGIIHRDLKPANLLLNDADELKIVDFGLAAVGQDGRSRITQSGILVGTPEYISPEQITGHDVDARTDLYSLGAVLYELASGKQPFAGANAVNVLFQHLEADIPRLSSVVAGIPSAVDELVMRCMSRFPDDRPASARAMLEMLRHVG
ncbi:MAG: HEAT repeat domain-containing protein [Candidatus Eisenbacteria bacterium]